MFSLFRVVTVREKSIKNRLIFFSSSGKSQGIVNQVREILNSTWKSVKSQVYFQKIPVNEFISVLALLASLPTDCLEWSARIGNLWSVKSQGNLREFFYPSELQPCLLLLFRMR